MDDGKPGVSRPVTVIIADDHTVVRDGVRAVLEREAGEFEVVAEAADIPSLIKAVREYKPDLLTLDLTMPGGSSLGALPSCFIAHPTMAVAILTMREDPEYARQALRAEARASARRAWRAYSGSSRIVRIATAIVGWAMKQDGSAPALAATY
jgi:DNA-binding NarL/FixJ family response regulator